MAEKQRRNQRAVNDRWHGPTISRRSKPVSYLGVLPTQK
jgi:hypothetical protein